MIVIHRFDERLYASIDAGAMVAVTLPHAIELLTS